MEFISFVEGKQKLWLVSTLISTVLKLLPDFQKISVGVHLFF
jgi:hypothetical protein